MNDLDPAIAQEMLTQNKRSTAWPIFVVVEDKKVWHPDRSILDADGKERIDVDCLKGDDLCEKCREIWEEEESTLPEDCDNPDCEGSFAYYRIEEDVPNMRAGFFFTAKACDEHIQAQRHHYDDSAKSYAISAFANHELQTVMAAIVGIKNVDKLR